MKTRLALPLVVAGTVVLAGCFDGSSSSSNPTTQVRVVHASSDAPAVNVRLNDDEVVSAAEFRQVAVLTPRTGTYSVAVDGLLPDGSTATVIDESGVVLERQVSYDVIATGKVGDDDVAPLILTDSGERESADTVRLRVAHLSPDAQAAAGGPVSVFLSDAGEPLPADPAFTFSFREDVGPLEVPAGDYQIRITPEGAPGTVVYDSGTVPLAAGADLLIGAIDNTVYGDSPVSLLVINEGETSELLDASTGAGIRAVHNAATAGDVDIYLNTEPDGTSAAVTALSFPETVPAVPLTGEYVSLDEGDNRVAVTATGDTAALIDATLPLARGDIRTVVAAGLTTDVEALVFEDDNRAIATAAKLRVIHGAAEAQVVNVYLVPTAEGGADATLIGNAQPALADFTFGDSSGYLQVPAGDYVVFITTTDNAQLFKSGSVTLANGGVYTAVARLAPDDPENTAGLTLMDDFAQP